MQSRSWRQRIRQLGILATGLAVALIIAGGPGHRLGVLPAKVALSVFALGTIIAAFALAMLLVAALMKRGDSDAGWGTHIIALLISGAITIQLGMVFSKAVSVPQIHDITTDTVNPPQFKALIGARADAANPLEYPGADTAALQRTAYPDLQTLSLTATPDSVLQAAQNVAARNGWSAIRLEGDNQLEATDTTFWFGFKDDVIVRATATATGTDLDIRSKSRVGKSDIGANAERIRALRDAIQQELSAQ